MRLKFLLGAFFILSLLGAIVLAPQQRLSRNADRSDGTVDEIRRHEGRRLRLLSWNIGNGDLESETRAHSEDLPIVAQVIMDNDPDAVALRS